MLNKFRLNEILKIKNYFYNKEYRSSDFLNYIYDEFIYENIVYYLGLNNDFKISINIDCEDIFLTIIYHDILLNKQYTINYTHVLLYSIDTYIQIDLNFKKSNLFYYKKNKCNFYNENIRLNLFNDIDNGELICDFDIRLNFDHIDDIKTKIFSNIAEHLQVPIYFNLFNKELSRNNSLHFFDIIESDATFEIIKLYYINDKNLSLNKKIKLALIDKLITKNQYKKLTNFIKLI